MQKAHFSLLIASLLFMTAREGSAQIGGGWQEYKPSSKIHVAEAGDIKTQPGNVTRRGGAMASGRPLRVALRNATVGPARGVRMCITDVPPAA
jgi:hypothetical protein